MTESSRESANQIDDQGHAAGLLTVPNALCLVRLLGSPVLAWVAWNQQPQVFLWLYLFLSMTDWFDGKLAILLNQRSVYGARLDSWADAAMYTALLFGLLRLHGPVLQSEWLWMAAAVATYAASTLYGIAKFRRWPSYHTKMAKMSWLFVTLATIAVLAEWSTWPLRIAACAVALTNLEAMLITATVSEWKVDVSSWFSLRSAQSEDDAQHPES